MTTALIGLASAALCYMLLNSLINIALWPRLERNAQPSEQPAVSILIPARNEAANIGELLRQLLAQSYAHFDIYLLDDQSTDETAQIALTVAGADRRLHLIHGAPLSAAWLGKNWACHQLSQSATGDILLFTDADVRWQPDALNSIVAEFTSRNLDAMCVWPTQITETWAERLTVPLISLVVLGYAPMWLFNHTNLPGSAAANGQCLLFWRDSYHAIGGHAAVRNAIVEDVALAFKIKQARRWLRSVDGNRLISCRMYQGWHEVLSGFGKNILAGHLNSVSFLIFSTLFHWAIFIGPWLWLLASWREPLWPFLLISAGIGIRAMTAHATGQRMGDALLLPISVLLMTRIALQSIYLTLWGEGLRWKDRTIG